MNSNFFFRLLNLFVALIFFAAPLKAQNKARQLDSLFKTMADRGDLNGTVLVSEDGKPIYKNSFGFSDLDAKIPLNDQSMFELASVSKQFTAMAIMQLKEKNKLQYDDELQNYFKELPYPGVTIRDLLQHTSGIPEFLGLAKDKLKNQGINNNADILALLPDNFKATLFKPREAMSYSNTNYILLALIIEKLSGLSFADYMDQYIFKPLAMSRTRIYSRRGAVQPEKNYALGYVYDQGKGKFVVADSLKGYEYVRYLDGIAGPYGISSTTEDLFKWDQALSSNKLVNKQTQDEAYIAGKLLNGKAPAMGALEYGFGWLIMPPGDWGNVYMHTGGYPGYATLIARYADKNKSVIILTNKWNTFNIYELFSSVDKILFDKPFTIPVSEPFKKSIALDNAQAAALEGTYEFKDVPGLKVKVRVDLGKIYVQLTNQPEFEVYAASPVSLFYTVVEAKYEFTEIENGKYNGLILSQNGKELKAVRLK